MSEKVIETVDYLMNLSEQGVEVHSGANVILNDLTEWLDTPKGEIFGRPSWGHELNKFKHETMNDDLANSVENSIFNNLLRDLPIVATNSTVAVALADFDRYQIVISTPWGEVSRYV